MNNNKDVNLVNNVAIIGIGLIGGSMALALKEKNIAGKIYGVDANTRHCEQAMALELVDQVKSLEWLLILIHSNHILFR